MDIRFTNHKTGKTYQMRKKEPEKGRSSRNVAKTKALAKRT